MKARQFTNMQLAEFHYTVSQKHKFNSQPYLDVVLLVCGSKSFLPKHTDILSQPIKAPFINPGR